MLPDALANAVREVGEAAGAGLLLDARRGRAIVGDATHLVDLCRNLRRAGFSRLVDFTAVHNHGSGDGPSPTFEAEQSEAEPARSAAIKSREDVSGSLGSEPQGRRRAVAATDSFTLLLTLRAPGYQHAALTLKWKWPVAATYTAPGGTGQPGDELQAGPVNSIADLRLSIDDLEEGRGSEPSIVNRHSSFVNPHPSLSAIWLAAAVAEREIFEMFGLPFAGNALAPLLLEEGFSGNPLRADYVAPAQASYAQRLVQQRHEAGLLSALVNATEGVVGQVSVPVQDSVHPAGQSHAGSSPGQARSPVPPLLSNSEVDS